MKNFITLIINNDNKNIAGVLTAGTPISNKYVFAEIIIFPVNIAIQMNIESTIHPIPNAAKPIMTIKIKISLIVSSNDFCYFS